VLVIVIVPPAVQTKVPLRAAGGFNALPMLMLLLASSRMSQPVLAVEDPPPLETIQIVPLAWGLVSTSSLYDVPPKITELSPK